MLKMAARKLFLACGAVVFATAMAAALTSKNVIEDAELAQDEIFVKVNSPVRYKSSVVAKNARLIVDFMDTEYRAGAKTIEGQGGIIKRARLSQYERKTRFVARLVLDLTKAPAKDEWLVIEKPDGLRIMFGSKDLLAAAKAADPDPSKSNVVIASEPAAVQPVPPGAADAEEPAPVNVKPKTVSKSKEPKTETPVAAAAAVDTALAQARLAEQQAEESAPRKLEAKPQNETKFGSKRVTLNLRGMSLTVILDAISKQTGANFIISKDLQGKQFTALMEGVTLRDALRALLEVQGMGYEQIGNSNTYAVKELSHTKMRLSTRVFKLKYTQLMDIKPKSLGEANLGQMSTGNTGGSSSSGGSSQQNEAPHKIDETTNNFLAVVKGMLSEYGMMRVYPETNSLIISELPESMPAIEELIESLDTPAPQVLIEASFVETNANAVKNLGIEYGASDGTMAQFQGNSMLVGFPLTMNGQVNPVGFEYTANTFSNTTPTVGNMFGGYSFGILSFNQLTAVLKAIETTGDGEYLSRPKVLTLNNKPAEISITANTVVQFDVKQFTGSGYLGEQSKTPIRQVTGIILWVTPQVNDNGMITLIITPEVSRPALSTFFPSDKVIDTERQAITTSVRVKDGSTVLIGGLMSNQKTNTIRKVPLLGHLPLIGALFTATSKSTTERELLVLITPRLVKDPQ